ncbi:MAG: hypothetical protein JNL67_01210 [Planctomycetaceae bacterium]|nr:hypothetical protein [Planctomycetaceae bacterium]
MSNKWLWVGCGLIVMVSGMGQVAHGQVATVPSPEQASTSAVKRQVAVIENSIADTQDRLEHSKMIIRKFEEQVANLGEQLAAFNVSEVSYPEVLMQLQVQRINLSIEKAGLDAKAEKLAELVSKERQPSEKNEQKRAKLQEILALEEQGLQRLNELHQSGVVPTSELLEGRKRIIQVELQLLELDSPQPSTSPEAVWAADMLAKIALDRVENMAKLAAIDELLRPLQHVRPTLSEMQNLKNEIETWQAEKSQMQTRQMELQDRLRDLKFKLDEVDSPDK